MSNLTFKFNAIPNEFLTDEFLEDHIMMKFIRWIYKNISSISRIGRMNGRNIPLEPFEFIFGRETSAEKAGISPMNARTRANQLKSMGYIEKVTSKSTSTFTVYRLVTEAFEQNSNQHSNQVTNQHSNQHSNHNIEQRTKNLRRNKEKYKKENSSDPSIHSIEQESILVDDPSDLLSREEEAELVNSDLRSDNIGKDKSVNDLQERSISNSLKKVKPKKTKIISQESLQLTEILLSKIKETNPFFSKSTNKWPEDFDRILKTRSFNQLLSLLSWIFQEKCWWRTKILSPEGLDRNLEKIEGDIISKCGKLPYQQETYEPQNSISNGFVPVQELTKPEPRFKSSRTLIAYNNSENIG